MKNLYIIITLFVSLCSCAKKDTRLSEAEKIQSELTIIIENLLEDIPRIDETTIDTDRIGKDVIVGSSSASKEVVYVVRTNTLVVPTDPKSLKTITNLIHEFASKLEGEDYKIEFASKTTTQKPEPQYFRAKISKGKFSGFVLLTSSAPMNGYLTITIVTYLN